jgi:hypothetical protein
MIFSCVLWCVILRLVHCLLSTMLVFIRFISGCARFDTRRWVFALVLFLLFYCTMSCMLGNRHATGKRRGPAKAHVAQQTMHATMAPLSLYILIHASPNETNTDFPSPVNTQAVSSSSVLHLTAHWLANTPAKSYRCRTPNPSDSEDSPWIRETQEVSFFPGVQNLCPCGGPRCYHRSEQGWSSS